MSDNWIKQLRDHSDDYRKTVPEGLLGDIKEEMARRGLSPAPAHGSAHLSAMNVRRRVAAAAVVALLVGMAVVSLWPDKQDAPTVASAPATAPAVSSTRESQRQSTAGHDLSQAVAVVHQLRQSVADKVQRIGQMTRADQPSIMDNAVAAASPTTGSPAVAETPAEDAQSSTGVSAPTPKVPDDGRTIPSQTHHDSPTAVLADAGRPRGNRSAGTWNVGAYYGNMGRMPSLTTNNGDAAIYYATAGILTDRVPFNEIAMLAGPPAVTSEHHNRPLRMGLSVRYRLTPRWSLQSGLIYSYLKSEFTTDKGYSNITTHQTLHYVGVPLTASYSLWQGRKVNVYASAGGMAEQLVSGRASTQETLAGQKRSSTSSKLSENRPVFSTQGALGVEYLATPLLSIYAEPGVSYYFDNGSDIKSSYTDKPFNLNLNLGVRLTIK